MSLWQRGACQRRRATVVKTVTFLLASVSISLFLSLALRVSRAPSQESRRLVDAGSRRPRRQYARGGGGKDDGGEIEKKKNNTQEPELGELFFSIQKAKSKEVVPVGG